jgi:deoxyribonuclease-4
MPRIGIHTSIAGSLPQAAERAHALGCNAFQIFSSSPRRWRAGTIKANDALILARLRWRYDLYPLAIHVNYLVNLASEDPVVRPRSIAAFRGELQRALALGAEYLILHPGSVKNGDRVRGLALLVAGMEESARGLPLNGLRILIENTAGAGGALGGDLAEVGAVIQHAPLPMGCCLDTAHSYAMGFDLSTPRGLSAWIRRVEETSGLDRVYVIHTNDSRAPLGSHRDRHEHIGKGGIGLAGFRGILNHPALREKAFILETPIDRPGDDHRNLEAVRKLVQRTRNAGKAIQRAGD